MSPFRRDIAKLLTLSSPRGPLEPTPKSSNSGTRAETAPKGALLACHLNS